MGANVLWDVVFFGGMLLGECFSLDILAIAFPLMLNSFKKIPV